MTTLKIKQDTLTGNYHLIAGTINPSVTYTLHNGRYFGLNSSVWVNAANSISRKNESAENPYLVIKGCDIHN